MGANLKEVRLRIASVKSTTQITKAMKMVSAAKLRRATDRIVQIRPYADQLNTVLQNIASNLGGEINLSFAQQRPVQKVLVVVITSDKGLCGGFNSNSIKATKVLLNEKYADLAAKGKVDIMTVGKKGYDAFKSHKLKINNDFGNLFGHLSFEKVSKAAEYIMYAFEQKEYDVVEVVYGKFKNAATQVPTVEQFLPIQAAAADAAGSKTKVDYIFEPQQEAILKDLVPKILKTQFFRYLLDSNASEHGARMTAMDKATENANELLKSLNIMYNRARQAAITTELTEIVSGAAALSQK
ncbi:MAG TPA: ATP synthase F1 subunit gamma [Chitinophagales bacterium]|nr:ATP synthase F1 subunit gamma [Chitinophagales bacterium]HQO89608.1 ATP synthase F1 subunit gamma [Chitinophagales bacterium]